MAYQCDRCGHWTADRKKHECIYDEFELLKQKVDTLEAALVDIGLHWKCDGKAGELARIAQKALAECRTESSSF